MARKNPRAPAHHVPGLADFLTHCRAEILDAWMEQVRELPRARELPESVLRDHIPEILDHIARSASALADGGVPQISYATAERHAFERLDEGFDLGQVVAELGVLRDCISRMWEQRRRDLEHRHESRILNQAIDKAVAASVERFMQARDRAIQALDRVSGTAVETEQLDDLLQRLLEVFVETTSAVDVAAIWLRDRDVLHRRASIGEAPETKDMRVGEGFVGRIAQAAEPISLASSDDVLIERDALRATHLRAVHGAPLLGDGDVIGVAYMGSRTAPEFSVQDKRVFAAMVTRVTFAITQHLLRETRERAVEDLREREQWFRTLADNIPLLVWMTDATGTGIWQNRRWFEYTGQPATDKPGWEWLATQHPDHVARVTEKFQRALAEEAPWEDTFPIRGKDGHYRWFLSRAIPIRDSSGKIDRWLGTNTDITGRRFLDLSTMVLSSSSLDYRETLETLARSSVPDLADYCLVQIVAPDGTLAPLAVAHEDPAKMELTRSWVKAHPPDPEGTQMQVVRTGEPVITEKASDEHFLELGATRGQLQLLRELLDIHSYLIVPLLARGRTLGVIILVMAESKRHYDASDLEVAMELGRRAGVAIDNARLYEETRQAVRIRDDVLAIVSHDLRNPLGAIDLSASLMLQTHGQDPRSRKQLEVVRRSVDRMQRLIHDLLEMASIQAGKIVLERTIEDAADILAEVLDVHEPLAAERGISIVRDWPPELCRLDCDRSRIVQVFGNLLGNATKFCRPGDTIFVRAACERERVRFTVADTGPGIQATALPHIFKPYWSDRREARKGTGLGLYISKGIVEAHGGEIHVDSTEGAGASFTFILPVLATP